MLSGTFPAAMGLTHNTSFTACVHQIARKIFITRDWCGCCIDLHLHKDGLPVTNACRKDLKPTCPSTRASRWQVKLCAKSFLTSYQGWTVWSQNNHMKVFKMRVFCTQISTASNWELFMCPFNLRSPIPPFMSPRLCNTFNIALSKHKPFSFQRQNFILSL